MCIYICHLHILILKQRRRGTEKRGYICIRVKREKEKLRGEERERNRKRKEKKKVNGKERGKGKRKKREESRRKKREKERRRRKEKEKELEKEYTNIIIRLVNTITREEREEHMQNRKYRHFEAPASNFSRFAVDPLARGVPRSSKTVRDRDRRRLTLPTPACSYF